MTDRLNDIIAKWTRIGAAFNAKPARQTPDLERLILDTAEALALDPQLLVIAASWLSTYPLFVAKHRLAALVTQAPAFHHRPDLGLLLDLVNESGKTAHFKEVLALCGPQSPPQPLYEVQRSSPVWRRVAKSEASAVSKKWGLWCQLFLPKDDAIRPATWIIKRNSEFFDRAVFRGDLRLSVLATLRENASSGESEVRLAQDAGGNRIAVRDAITALEQAGYVRRKPVGRRNKIELLTRHRMRRAA